MSDYKPFDDGIVLPSAAAIKAEYHRCRGGDRMIALEQLGFDLSDTIDWKFVHAFVDGGLSINDDLPANELAILLPNDLLLIDLEARDYRTVTGQARWLGKITGTVRLHPTVFDWLASGGAGVCSLPHCYRGHMTDLQFAESVICEDVYTALQAHDWGGVDLDRITVDGPTAPYFDNLARIEAAIIVHAEAQP